MRRSNQNGKSGPQPPPENPSETGDESSINSDVELELLASSRDEEQCEVNSNEGNAPSPPPSSPARPTSTDYVMQLARVLLSFDLLLFQLVRPALVQKSRDSKIRGRLL